MPESHASEICACGVGICPNGLTDTSELVSFRVSVALGLGFLGFGVLGLGV